MTYQLDSEEMAMVKDLLRRLERGVVHLGDTSFINLSDDDDSAIIRLTEELNYRLK